MAAAPETIMEYSTGNTHLLSAILTKATGTSTWQFAQETLGRQIVPEKWTDASFVPRGRSRFNDRLYGYGWWMRDISGCQAYYAWGFGGQFIVLVPDLNLVIVSTSAPTVSDDRRTHRRTVDDIIEHLIVAPIAHTQSNWKAKTGTKN
jgi:CubicO group peptidase (beta-lactamase class C family)